MRTTPTGRLTDKLVDAGTGHLNLLTHTDYDKSGRVWQTVDANGTITRYGYDAADRVLTRTVDPDAGGLALVTSFTYDPIGRQATQTDPDGRVTRTAYDGVGHVLTRVVDDNGKKLTTTFTYDGRGNTLTVTDDLGAVTRYTYDDLGRRTRMDVDVNGVDLYTQYAYDAAGNLARTIDPSGSVTRYVYDADKRLRYTLDAAGILTRNDYDNEGRLLGVTTYYTPQAAVIATTTLAGGVVRNTLGTITVNNLDRNVSYVYDDDGRKTAMKVDTGIGVTLTTQYAYDASGNLARVIDPAGNVTRYVYDAANRLRYVLDGENRLKETVYDKAGNVTATIAWAKPQSMTTAVSATGVVTNTLAAVQADSVRDRVTRVAYDKAGRASMRWMPTAPSPRTSTTWTAAWSCATRISSASRCPWVATPTAAPTR